MEPQHIHKDEILIFFVNVVPQSTPDKSLHHKGQLILSTIFPCCKDYNSKSIS